MLRKLSFASGLRSASGPGKDTKQFQGKVVKYSPYSAQHIQEDDDLEGVAVISAANPENVRYGGSSTSGQSGHTVNGPRVVPGIITTAGSASYGAK